MPGARLLLPGGLLALLVASLGTNAVLARAVLRPGPPGMAMTSPTPGSAASSADRGPEGQAGMPRPSGGGAAAPACGPEVTALERQLEERSVELRQLAPAQQLFAEGAPHPEAEARLAPLVAAALAGVEAGRGAHRLTCRDVACELVIEERPGAGEESADQALSRHPELAAWIGQLEPGAPAEAGGRRRTLFFKLNAEREAPPPAGAQRPKRDNKGR